jgi:hypothetical protein
MLVVALLVTSHLLLASLLTQAATNLPAVLRSNVTAAVPPVTQPATPPEMPPVPLGARSSITFFR